jgi:AcrR family transcriptional regulator
MPRRSAADAARTRSDILVEARRLFAEQGYVATTTSQIAEGAGVTVGALFHHFEGKAGLFRDVFQQLEDELDAHVRETAGPEGSAHAIDVFLAGFRAYLEFAMKKEFHRIVMLEGPVVLGEEEWHAFDARRGATTLMEGLELLVAEGVIEDRPLKPLGLLLVGAMSEAGFQVARSATRKDLEGLIEAMRYLLTSHLNGKSPRGGASKAPARSAKKK